MAFKLTEWWHYAIAILIFIIIVIIAKMIRNRNIDKNRDWLIFENKSGIENSETISWWAQRKADSYRTLKFDSLRSLLRHIRSRE